MVSQIVTELNEKEHSVLHYRKLILAIKGKSSAAKKLQPFYHKSEGTPTKARPIMKVCEEQLIFLTQVHSWNASINCECQSNDRINKTFRIVTWVMLELGLMKQ